MATINVDVDTKLSAITYVGTDTMNVRQGAQLEVDASTTVDLCDVNVTDGNGEEIWIHNASTTVPIVITMANNDADIIMQSGGLFKAEGEMIVVHTSDGTSAQTIDFTSIGGVSIDLPTYVEVETGNGTGIYRPWFIRVTGTTPLAVTYSLSNSATIAGTSVMNEILQYDLDTQIMTTGNGTYGVIPVTGVKFRIPNIHFTGAGTFQASLSARSQINISAGGKIDVENVSFSHWMYINISAPREITLANMGVHGGMNPSDGVFPMTATNISVITDIQNVNIKAWLQSNFTGAVTLDTLRLQPTNQRSFELFTCLNLASVKNIYCLNTDNGTGSGILLNTCLSADPNTAVENIWFSRGGVVIDSCQNMKFKTLRYSNFGGAAPTRGILYTTQCKNVLALDTEPITGYIDEGMDRNIITASNTIDNEGSTTNGITADYQGANDDLVSGTRRGASPRYANIVVLNGTSTDYVGANSTEKFVSLINVYAQNGINFRPSPGIQVEFVNFTNYSEAMAVGSDCNGFFTEVDDYRTPTIGVLWLGSYYQDNFQSGRFDFGAQVETTDYRTNADGQMFLITAGAYATIQAYRPVKGITTFTGTMVVNAGSALSNFAIDFRMADAGTTTWDAWATMSQVNLNAGLAARTGYTVQEGFEIQIRYTHPTGSATDFLESQYIDFTPATYTPNVGELEVVGTQQETGATMHILDASDGAVLESLAETSGTSTANIGMLFDGEITNIVMRSRQAGYTTAQVSDSISYVPYSTLLLGSEMFATIASDPGFSADFTITDHGVSPVTWNAKDFSITITLVDDSLTISELRNQISWSTNLTATFNGIAGVRWPDMVLTAETQRGDVVGTVGADLKGVRIVKSDGTTAMAGVTQFQADDGTYYTPVVPVDFIIQRPNILDGANYIIENTTQVTEPASGTTSGGTGIDVTLVEGTDYAAGDNIRLRIGYTSGVTAKLPISESFTGPAATSTNNSPTSMEDYTVYNTIGIDGSTKTGIFSADYVDDEIDVTLASDFLGQDFMAWWVYNEATLDGLRNFYGVYTLTDEANIVNNTTVLGVMFDNTTTTNIKQIDNVRIYRSDAAYPVRDPSSGGGCIDIVWREKVLVTVVTTAPGTSVVTGDIADIRATLTDLDVDIVKVNGVSTTGVDDFKATTASLDNLGVNIQQVNGVSTTGIDDFKATTASLDNLGVNIQQVNGYDVKGEGTDSNPWNPI